MKTRFLIHFFLGFIGLLSYCSSYVANTTDQTSLIYNNSFFSGLTGWNAVTTANMTEVLSGTVNGRSVVKLRTYFFNTTDNKPCSLQTWDNVGIVTTYKVIDFRSVDPPIVHDGIIVKVYIQGSDTTTYGSGTVAGLFSVGLQGGLSWATTQSFDTDTRVIQLDAFQSSSATPVFGVMTTWNVLTFSFIPPGYCDWWEIRNLQLKYTAMANQPGKTEVIIDRVELYAISIDDQ